MEEEGENDLSARTRSDGCAYFDDEDDFEDYFVAK